METMIWHPWRNHPIDWIGKTLYDSDNNVVTIQATMTGLAVTVNDCEVLRGAVDAVCAWLNNHAVTAYRTDKEKNYEKHN